ncbi:DUF2268 domain-containing putative Zn-dependent protease [Piscibacillus sp. B03]|uniref:DUF2268 domain-containing putative Zn-dependent protease n=1 Tax=Piscibacillus sp. B03 TaxID=3457430 RepID=UPI003FCDECC8
MWKIDQLPPKELLKHQSDLNSYLYKRIDPLITSQSWMQDWNHIVRRFKLLEFQSMSQNEIMNHSWDYDVIENALDEALTIANKHIPLENTTIMVVPARPFKWFESFNRSMWSNAFTLGPNTIIVAVPPQPNIEFLKYLITHEAHHACHLNPIYELSLDDFTLADWFKMEGTAEYFSLSFYKDLRWWKNNLNQKVHDYWLIVKPYLKTTDDLIKSKLCFGDSVQHVPVFAGYCFAYELVKRYAKANNVNQMLDLYSVTSDELIHTYKSIVEE